MSYPDQAGPERVNYFSLEKVIIESDRLPIKFDVRNVATDIDIYEHIDKPYLTASIVFIDSEGIFTGMDFVGGEKITIEIKSTRTESTSIRKVFYVTSIMNAVKINDQNEVIGLNLIEDIGYFSNLINVNKSFFGSCYKIIQNIFLENLRKDVTQLGNDIQSKFNVIVPNLNPLEAASWIKNKATDENGFPFFLYSTLVEDDIKFSSLSSLLREVSMNSYMPFTYWQTASTSDNQTAQRRTILSYTYADVENMFELINAGTVGARYTYLDTFTGNHTNFAFDVMKDALTPYLENKIDTSGTQLLPIDEKMLSFDNIPINRVQSKTITQIGSAGVFNDGTSDETKKGSYSEESNVVSYKKKAISRAIHKFLTKAPMSIVVNGYDFIDGTYNTTLGNKISINFINSAVHSFSEDRIDPKRSGDYLIYATRHMFKKERYDLALSCVKIGNNR